MRTVIPLLLCLVSLAPTGYRAGTKTMSGSVAGVTFSDDFNRANSSSLGANWTEAAGNCNIESNELEITATSAADTAIYNTSTGTLNQFGYGKLTVVFSGAGFGSGFVFRFVNASSPLYYVKFTPDSDLVTWIHATLPGGTYSTINSQALTVNTGDIFGVTLDGTGLVNTKVRVWRNPTATAPTNATTWDGVGPGITIDMAGATSDKLVETGTLMGFTGTPSALGGLRWDNFNGGSL